MPSFPTGSSNAKRAFVVNAILNEELILDHVNGYFFYSTYPQLSSQSLTIIIPKEYRTIEECMDSSFNRKIELAALRRMSPVDLWAAYFAVGAGGPFADTIDVRGALKLFNKMKKFYKETKVRILRLPCSSDETEKIFSQVDKKVGEPYIKFLDYLYFGADSESQALDICGPAFCVLDVTYSRLMIPYGYALFPSHYWQIMPSYIGTLSKIEEGLKQDVRLNKIFKVSSAEESIRYLLGQKVESLNELLGFIPLNPLKLVSSNVTDPQVDQIVLKIRKDCKKIRELIEKIHINCLQGEFEKAVDAKLELADMKANQKVNYSILDNTNEFMEQKLKSVIYEFIDKTIQEESKSKIIKLHKILKKSREIISLKGLLSEVKFLTFGTLLLLLSCGIDVSYLREILRTLSSTSLSSGAVGVVLRILEKGMEICPGFNIYASFIKWPKLA